jgi:hypothetical protein
MMRTLFLQPPSFEGFDGGAGSRYQAKREIRSHWYPTWLAQPAALVPGSRLVDAPPAGLTLAEVAPLAREYELAVLHTSSPTFPGDIRAAEALKAANPRLLVGLVGAAVAVLLHLREHLSVAAPYPGTELYRQAVEAGWLPAGDEGTALVSSDGTQLAALSYPHLGHTEILDSVDVFYQRFYFRAGKIAEMSAELLRHPGMTSRRLREGTEFARFLSRRDRTPAPSR